MQPLSNYSIRIKLVVIMMLTSLVGVTVASISFIVHERNVAKNTTFLELAVFGEIIANRSSAALLFDDRKLAEENLNILAVKDNIIKACILDGEMQIFSSYPKQGGKIIKCELEESSLGVFEVGDYIVSTTVIKFDNNAIGTLIIYSDLSEMGLRLEKSLIIAFFIFLFSLFTSAVIASWLQNIIYKPISQLTSLITTVTDKRDYKIRAKKITGDEIGTLVDAFNIMLATVQKSNQKLIDSKLDLEDIVKERTQALTSANEQLKELDKLKSMFIASMSHELRTPLNSIIGFTEIILNGMSGDLTERQTDQLSRVYKCANNLLSLITDIIDISKIEADRIDVYIEELNIADLCQEAIDSVYHLLKGKTIEISTNVDKSLVITTDRKRLYQCVLNVLSNSIKYSDKGLIRINVIELDDRISIAISDSGIGMAEENIAIVFEAFERLDSHLKVKAGGTGLGLYLVNRILKTILQGEIDVKSELGIGSTFTLYVPKVLSTNGEQIS